MSSLRSRLAIRTRANKLIDQALRRRYRFVGDGIATQHLCEFETDPGFTSVWPDIEKHWQPGLDVRWRLWILRRLVEHAAKLDGAFAEFGTYRGGCSSMALSTGALPKGRPFYLFDTFAGIAPSSLEDDEAHLIGEFSNTSPAYAEELLKRWDRDNVRFVVGDVFDTLKETETGPLAFVHLDLNAAEPTRAALEYAYPRLVSGGVLLMDDYGWDEFRKQRSVIDEFAARENVSIVSFPTGTAMMLKV